MAGHGLVHFQRVQKNFARKRTALTDNNGKCYLHAENFNGIFHHEQSRNRRTVHKLNSSGNRFLKTAEQQYKLLRLV